MKQKEETPDWIDEILDDPERGKENLEQIKEKNQKKYKKD